MDTVRMIHGKQATAEQGEGVKHVVVHTSFIGRKCRRVQQRLEPMGAEGTNGNHQKAINTGQGKNVFESR